MIIARFFFSVANAVPPATKRDKTDSHLCVMILLLFYYYYRKCCPGWLQKKQDRQSLVCDDTIIILFLLWEMLTRSSKRDKTELCEIIIIVFFFWLQEMLSRLPPKEARQTLLFSATMPSDVKTIASLGMRENYVFVDTVGVEENTHQHVPQQFATQKSI